ncbi:hypothetical protein Syun_004416 [Stephania yunnanensis]|uniref:Uncharacterized protein n=1 Tax=Stephania yunnanensis TaxID=152371 RepID=A0AAP0L756_9MAGN
MKTEDNDKDIRTLISLCLGSVNTLLQFQNMVINCLNSESNLLLLLNLLFLFCQFSIDI